MMQRTLSIIKPDAMAHGHMGLILDRLIKAGFNIIAMRRLHLSLAQAEAFYAEHRLRPFFDSLVRYMSSGPVLVSVLEGKDAISVHRRLMGATDPTQAEPGTIRRDFGEDIEHNAVHGSDGPQAAATEIAFFFSRAELEIPSS